MPPINVDSTTKTIIYADVINTNYSVFKIINREGLDFYFLDKNSL